ncbi:hypothetical protein G6F31_021773 [Rhizopus arrhizus]|nr:hypothetical protein G6F31_021773 [Rhizopus arrhizus]
MQNHSCSYSSPCNSATSVLATRLGWRCGCTSSVRRDHRTAGSGPGNNANERNGPAIRKARRRMFGGTGAGNAGDSVVSDGGSGNATAGSNATEANAGCKR